MSTIFSKIIQGEIPSVKLAETDTCLAFMDINPLKKGHVLVIPKIEVDEIYELGDTDLSDLFLFAKKICQAMKKTFDIRIGMVVVGYGVPHAHIHLLPVDSEQDINFDNPKLRLSTEKLTEIAESIKINIS
jgi:histidine triad (HIT) family protein